MNKMKWSKKAQIDFGGMIDIDIFYEPAYWVVVALAFLGFAIGFSGADLFGTEGAYISIYTKAILLISIIPVAYVVVKIIRR